MSNAVIIQWSHAFIDRFDMIRSMIILLHSSKTMRTPTRSSKSLRQPTFLKEAIELDSYLKKLTVGRIASLMQLSKPMAAKTHALIANWTSDSAQQTAAIDCFLGDIYSGLQVQTFTAQDRTYADNHLYILSGLYGVLRALDGIYPYRFEMGYRPTVKKYHDLYKFWGDKIANQVANDEPIINISSAEYDRVILPYVDQSRIIKPKFLTKNSATGEPTFVTVHAKVARGAFAHWLITQRITKVSDLKHFDEINYHYDKSLSTEAEPVFVCDNFGGIGLSVRLT